MISIFWIITPIFISLLVQLVGLIKETEPPLTFIKRHKTKITVFLWLLSALFTGYNGIVNSKSKVTIDSNPLIVKDPYPVRVKDSLVEAVTSIVPGMRSHPETIRRSDTSLSVYWELRVLNKGIINKIKILSRVGFLSNGRLWVRKEITIRKMDGNFNATFDAASIATFNMSRKDTCFLYTRYDYADLSCNKYHHKSKVFEIINDEMFDIPPEYAKKAKILFGIKDPIGLF